MNQDWSVVFSRSDLVDIAWESPRRKWKYGRERTSASTEEERHMARFWKQEIVYWYRNLNDEKKIREVKEAVGQGVNLWPLQVTRTFCREGSSEETREEEKKEEGKYFVHPELRDSAAQYWLKQQERRRRFREASCVQRWHDQLSGREEPAGRLPPTLEVPAQLLLPVHSLCPTRSRSRRGAVPVPARISSMTQSLLRWSRSERHARRLITTVLPRRSRRLTKYDFFWRETFASARRGTT